MGERLKVAGSKRFFQIHEWGRVTPLDTKGLIVLWENPKADEVFFIDKIGNNWDDGALIFLTVDDEIIPLYSSMGEVNAPHNFNPPLVCERSFRYEVYNGTDDPEFLFEIQAIGQIVKVK